MCIKKLFKKKEEMKKNWIYYGVFLSETSKNKLLNYVKDWFKKTGREFPTNWTEYADHMTLVFNNGNPEDQAFADTVEPVLGLTNDLRIVSIGISDRAIAAGIDYITNNEHSHITIAVCPGGKPVESNYINEWIKTDGDFYVTGTYKKVS
jgi:hypothetical protein